MSYLTVQMKKQVGGVTPARTAGDTEPGQERSRAGAGGLTGLSGGSRCRSSGAIQPSVPGMPERRLKLQRPAGSFLQRPKSERTTLLRPWLSGPEMRTLAGFKSRCTVRAEGS